MSIVDVGFDPVSYDKRGDGEPLLLMYGTGFGFGAGLLGPQIADLNPIITAFLRDTLPPRDVT